jgi:hypothetical protein
MSKAVKSVTKAVVEPVKKVVSGVNDVRKDVTKAVTPEAIYNPISRTSQKVGSAVSGTLKDVTGKALNSFSEVLRPLGPLGVPLGTLALSAAGIPPPLAAALISGANTAGRVVDATGSLTKAGKAGVTSGGISGLASLGGQALGKYLEGGLTSQLSRIYDIPTATEMARAIAPALTQGTMQGGLGALLGNQKFGRGFVEGALTSGLGTGLNSLLKSSGVTDPTYRKLGEIIGENKLGAALGLGGGSKPAGGQTGSSLMPGEQQAGGGFDLMSLLLGGAGGAGIAALLNKDKGGAAPTAPAPAGGTPATAGAPSVPGTLDIGRIGQAFVPKQDLSYGSFAPPPQMAGLMAAPITPAAMPAYFRG